MLCVQHALNFVGVPQVMQMRQGLANRKRGLVGIELAGEQNTHGIQCRQAIGCHRPPEFLQSQMVVIDQLGNPLMQAGEWFAV
jgi:hypothetical protein